MVEVVRDDVFILGRTKLKGLDRIQKVFQQVVECGKSVILFVYLILE